MQRPGQVFAASLALLGFAAGIASAQGSVTGRWHVRLSTGREILRGDLRLDQRGTTLTGSLALETSDDPPVAIRDGRLAADGTVEFAVAAPEAMRFTGRRDGSDLSGEARLDRGRVWRWTAQRLPEGAEFYAALPRFRASQLVVGRNASELRLPGAWVAAAVQQPAVGERADALATAAGLAPIPADSVQAYGFLPVLGLARRDELVPALVQALATIRAQLPDGERIRFDAIFRPRREWLVDLHAAALDEARNRFQRVTWEDARPALAAAGLLPGDLPPGASVIPTALYRLATLREQDSLAFQAARDRLSRGGAASAERTSALLDGYRAGAEWQAKALAFLLSATWVEGSAGPTSPAGLMREARGRPDLPVPAIRPRYFGIPEAVPRVGVPPEVVGRIVAPENWAAEEWVKYRGPTAMLDVLRRLRLDIGINTTLEADGPSIVTSVAREAADGPGGFLESADTIVEDPGAPPLFAVATAMHEWQHLLMERHRLSLGTGGTLRSDGVGLHYLPSDLFLAEGLSEWETARLLAPLLTRSPIVGVGDAHKLAVLESGNPSDPHVLGLQMMRALAAALGSPADVRALVLAHGDDPFAVAAAVSAWRTAALPDRVLPAQGQRRLIPETTFTIEDGVGDVLRTRILVVADSTPGK